MLFDLRGRGRRRTVQVIYLSLAILMGGGLVFFGIGGSVQGGLFDAFREDSQGTDASEQIKRQLATAERATRTRPRDPAPWAQLARTRFQVAGTEGFDNTTNQFTDKGRARLRTASAAWERHLALTKRPDERVAALMVQAYGPGGLNQLDKAVGAQEIVAEERKPPSSNLYAQLAVLAYQAGQTRKGDLASGRAVELAPKDQRALLGEQLKNAKRQVTAGATAG